MSLERHALIVLSNPGNEVDGRAALSERERRLAELVASDRDRQEIARTLLVSEETVEWNIARLYRKLGIESGAELAASVRHAYSKKEVP